MNYHNTYSNMTSQYKWQQHDVKYKLETDRYHFLKLIFSKNFHRYLASTFFGDILTKYFDSSCCGLLTAPTYSSLTNEVANLSWSWTLAKFCQIIASLSGIPLQLKLTKLKLDALSLTFSTKIKDMNIDKFTINWQNIAPIWLKLKITFVIRL